MAKEKNQSIHIGKDAKNVINVTGDRNIVYQFIVYQFIVTDPSKMPSDIKDLISSGKAKPTDIEGVTLHNLPFPRNPMFTGREELLEKLHESLAASGSTALSQPPAISGMGGIGKTQIAIEYAYQHIDEYKVVLWVNSDGTAAITSSYSEIARLLDLPEKDEQELNVVIGAVRSWLESNKEWLLIYDNVDDPEIITAYQPRSHEGRILITSKATAFGNLATALVVEKMVESDAVDFLLKRAKMNGKEDIDLESAIEICTEFGLFPLAIDHAGSFVEATGCNLSEYLKSFKEKGIEVLKDKRYASKDYDYTVATTWSMSLERLQKDSPAAVQIISLCAFFAPDAIPLELIKAGADSFEEPLKSVVSDTFEFNKALGDLQRYSLISRRAGEDEFSIHRLLQAVIAHDLGESEARKWAGIAVNCLHEALPDVTVYRNWPECERLLPHILMIAQHIDSLSISSETAGSLFNEAGVYLDGRADYAEAGLLYQRALEVYEEVHGPEDSEVATILSNLALLHYNQGKYADSEPLNQRALEIRERVHGPEHPKVAISLNNLAQVYNAQGMYSEAEPLCQRALEITENALGPEHPDVAIRLNNLAALYDNQGKYAEAEPLFDRSLEIREKVHGPEHPDVATSLNNLAVLYSAQGRYAEAEPLHRRSLGILEKVLGPEHPHVASSLCNLATVYQAQGKYVEAEPLLQRALEIEQRVLGPQHPSVATSLDNLAALFTTQFKYSEAEPLHRRAVEILESVLGPEHPDVAICLNNFAAHYYAQGKYAEAEPLYQRAHRIKENVLGPEHPDVACGLHNLGMLLCEQGREKEGIEMVRRAYRILRDILGPDHPNTINTLKFLESWGVKPE